jgi:quercetin dioxygenase-like cupin family protein
MKTTSRNKKAATGKRRGPSSSANPGRISKASARHHAWAKVELETLNPLLQRQIVTGTDVMLARILLKKGCVVPLHSHYNEQLSYVIEGALKFTIRGKDTIVRAGEVLTIPPHVPHLVKALRNTVSLDIFHPPRMDWLNKSDAYLRK